MSDAGWAVGMWLNWDLTRWQRDDTDRGRWFGFDRYQSNGMQRNVLALGLVALVYTNELTPVPPKEDTHADTR